MTLNLSWDDLRILRAVATTGSLSAAARALGLNHATVLRRVARFEERRGITLFHRSRRGYRVDPRAAALVEAIAHVETAVERVDRLIEGERDALAGPYVVTTTNSLATTGLPRHVSSFLAENSGLDLTVASTNAHMDLGRLDAEATIRPARELPEDLRGTRVGTLRLRVYGAPGYLRRHGSDDPGDHRWLGVSELLGRSPSYA